MLTAPAFGADETMEQRGHFRDRDTGRHFGYAHGLSTSGPYPSMTGGRRGHHRTAHLDHRSRALKR